jgi:hypothetical protein
MVIPVATSTSLMHVRKMYFLSFFYVGTIQYNWPYNSAFLAEKSWRVPTNKEKGV